MIDSLTSRKGHSYHGPTRQCLNRNKAFNMHKLIKRFRRDDEGAALVEYGLLVGLIAVVCAVAIQTLGTQIDTLFLRITAFLAGVIGG